MSEKPVAERLQVKRDRLLAVIGATPSLDALVGASEKRTEPARADVVLLFVRDHTSLQAQLKTTIRELRPTSILWLAYPKLSSKLAGDLDRDLIRKVVPAYGLGSGPIDVSVAI